MADRKASRRGSSTTTPPEGDGTITLFVPLSGRREAWDTHLRPFLDGQTWPRARIRLILADTSQDLEFGQLVRAWLATSEYARHDARYYAQVVGARGLVDQPRPGDGGTAVNDAMRAIYSRMARDLATELVLVVEDDHRPPDDALERLLAGLTSPDVVAVSGLYRNRMAMHNGEYVAWLSGRQDRICPAEGPAIAVSGTGFGCLLLRRSVLAGETFAHRAAGPLAYDVAFCARVRANGGLWKLDRSLLVEHVGAPPFPPLKPRVPLGEKHCKSCP